MELNSNKKPLEGKIALITGASRGIGAGIAYAFAENGATVYANAREEESLFHLTERFPELIKPICFDVTDNEAAKISIVRIQNEQRRLDILVNNAGIMLDALIGMVTHDLMQKIFEVNLFAPINLTQLAARIMSKSGTGSIINISSIVGTRGNAGQSIYSASKGALISFTLSASKELAPKGIRVNAIAPGIIKTDLLKNVEDRFLEQKISAVGMGRIGYPEDIASAAVFLASDMSSYITGQVLGVDGGQIL